MKVLVWGEWQQAQDLHAKIGVVLEELWLTDFVAVNTTADEAVKSELSISEESALIIEEESIDFKDMIFEGMIPEEQELKSMFMSIIWGSTGWCAPEGCGSGCSC